MTERLKELTAGLRVLDERALRRAAGGYQVASTSLSGRPEAGDDTIGDSLGGGGAGKVAMQDFPFP